MSPKLTLRILFLSLFVTPAVLFPVPGATAPAQGQTRELNANDVVVAYRYLLGRWLVLRQETRDFKQGFNWNELIHREPGGVERANPDLGFAYSEAWIAVDESSCTLVELPPIKDRYYTLEVLNGWGEVTANINDRTYPKHPSGTFGLCLKGAKVALPPGTERVDLPSHKARVVIRIELGSKPEEAAALQKQITMKATGAPKIAEPVGQFDFADSRLPSINVFDSTEEVLASESDINKGMTEPQKTARAIAQASLDPDKWKNYDAAIDAKAIPSLYADMKQPGPAKNGWSRPRAVGNYGDDYRARSLVNFTDIWANNSKESISFGNLDLDGDRVYTQTFPKGALPGQKARYFWSVTAVDDKQSRVVPNPLDRYMLDEQSPLELNPDGSLTLVYGPSQPAGSPAANWLPTPAGKKYKLTFRFYGPSADVVSGAYFPPPLVLQPRARDAGAQQPK